MRKRVVLSKLFATLGIALFGAPLVLILGALITPVQPAVWLVPLLFSLLLACGLLAIPRRKRVPWLILSIPLSLSAPALFGYLLAVKGLWAVFSVLITGAMLLHLTALMHESGEEYLSPVWYVGILVYLLARFLTLAQSMRTARTGIEVLAPCYFVYILFALNEQAVLDGMGGDRAPSRLMRWRNRIAVAIMAGILLGISYISLIQQAVKAILTCLKRVLAAVLAWLLRPKANPLPEEVREAAERGESFMMEAGEPAAWLVFLEKVMRAAAVLLLVALVLFGFWQLSKLLRRVFKALIAKLRAYANQVNEAYEDTVESLLDWGEVKRAMLEKTRKLRPVRRTQIPWEKLPPRERVRRLYQDYWKVHPELPESLTARRVLRGRSAAAALYERARYSSLPIRSEEADNMREEMKAHKGETE